MPASLQNIPVAPAGFDKERFFTGVYWHQKWEVFQNVFTPGSNPIREMCDDLSLPANLSGQRVLDIGAWNGCLSFECERRGAREVVALSPEDPEATGFHKLRVLLGSQKVHYLRGSVYNLDPRRLGYFDIVLFCGVLYHLRHPLLGIDNIRRVCRGEVYIETVVSDGQLILKQGDRIKRLSMDEISPDLQSIPLWQFYRLDELDGDTSNWFGPNCLAVVEAFESAGFKTEVLKRCGRATFRGRLKSKRPEFLEIGCTEGDLYDTVMRPVLGSDERSQAAAPGAARAFTENVQVTVLSSPEYFEKNGKNEQSWLNSVYQGLLGQAAAPAGAKLPLRKPFHDDRAYRRLVVEDVLHNTAYRVRLLRDYYTRFLGRSPAPVEEAYWLKVFDQAASPELLQAEFLASDECFNGQEASNARWLDYLYTQLLGKTSTPDRKVYLDALEANTVSRIQIALAVLESVEYRQHIVEMTYRDLLGRPASQQEVEAWLESSIAMESRSDHPHLGSPTRPLWRGILRAFGARRSSGARSA